MDSENDSDFESIDNLDDDRRHAKLLEEIQKLDKNNRISKYQVEQRCEPATQVSEFHLAQGGKEYVKLDELMMPLKKSQKYETLKKQVKSLTRRKATLPTPLPKPQAERIQRGIAYEKVTSELRKWNSIVETNRKADQLVFPLKQPNLRIMPSAEFVKRFQPKTPLEIEVAQLLQQSDHVIQTGKELSKAEELALRAMSIEEAQECRRQLQIMRAKASYQEAKARRQNKIKSKRYHRILKREKIRKALKEFEELKKTNPELAAEKLKELDKQRIEERMTLKHRSTGKWAKQQKLRAKYDDSAREALDKQVELYRQLTTKAVLPLSDSDEEAGMVQQSQEEITKDQDKFFTSVNYNPWLLDSPQQKESNSSATNTDVKRNRSVITVNETDETDDADINAFHLHINSSNDNKTEVEVQVKADVDHDDRVVKFSEESLNDKVVNNASSSKGQQQHGTSKGKDCKKKKKGMAKEFDGGAKMQHKAKSTTEEKIDIEEEIEEEPQIVESLTRRQRMEDFDNMEEEDEEAKDALESSMLAWKSEMPKVLGNEEEDKSPKEEEKIEIDPSKIITMKTKVLKSAVPNVIASGEEAFDADEQRMLIAEAFAEENVVEEFIAEKEAAEESNKPKSVDLTLPGWGSWSGPGIEPRQQKKRVTQREKKNPKKRLSHLGNVIFSEKRNEKLLKHKVKELPYPFSSVQQFENSIRQPIGITWNPESVFKKLTEPPVVTKLGKIIDPIDSDALLQTQPKNRERGQPFYDKSTPIVIPL